MKYVGEDEKTLVFCSTQNHAGQIRDIPAAPLHELTLVFWPLTIKCWVLQKVACFFVKHRNNSLQILYICSALQGYISYEDAGIIKRCYNTHITELPLDGNAINDCFKVYMGDMGLFVSMLEYGTQADILIYFFTRIQAWKLTS